MVMLFRFVSVIVVVLMAGCGQMDPGCPTGCGALPDGGGQGGGTGAAPGGASGSGGTGGMAGSPSPAIPVGWTNKTPRQLPEAWPPARERHAMVYDASRQRVVLFGGNGKDGPLNDLWEWDGATWTNRTPSPLPEAWPLPVLAHAIVYHDVRESVLLYGGIVSGVGRDGEVWEWNGKQGLWSSRPSDVAAPSPGPPRFSHGMAYDLLRNRTVIYGGSRVTDGKVMGDTWELASEYNSTWVDVSPQGSKLGARDRHAMVWDGARKRVALFGGGDGLQPSMEGWEWDGVRWDERRPAMAPIPEPRTDLHAAFDGVRGLAVMFGGGGSRGGPRQDTWEWSSVAASWRNRTPEQLPESGWPAVRRHHAMAFDARRGVVVLFGGEGNNDKIYGDVWEWNGGAQ